MIGDRRVPRNLIYEEKSRSEGTESSADKPFFCPGKSTVFPHHQRIDRFDDIPASGHPETAAVRVHDERKAE
jgi:hypothetical protein